MSQNFLANINKSRYNYFLLFELYYPNNNKGKIILFYNIDWSI